MLYIIISILWVSYDVILYVDAWTRQLHWGRPEPWMLEKMHGQSPKNLRRPRIVSGMCIYIYIL